MNRRAVAMVVGLLMTLLVGAFFVRGAVRMTACMAESTVDEQLAMLR